MVTNVVLFVLQAVTPELYNPPPAPDDPIRKFVPFPCVVTVACEFSSETPNHTLFPKFLTSRTPY